MKKAILFLVTIVFLLSFSKVLADELCSPVGYSIYTINGIFNDERDAKENKKALESKLTKTYNYQPVTVGYLYNPTHLAGAGDLIDAVKQGIFEQKSDYDLIEMINDASGKVATQKVLLVGHSQGNFYANNFYDKVSDQEGGIPSRSLGVYGVASPASRVAGGGLYITSDTDNVIAAVVGKYIKILKPNAHVPLGAGDGNGHGFSNVYLKYQGDRIIREIKSSLDKLKDNDEQLPDSPCISPPELSTVHKIEGVVLAVADPTAIVVKNGAAATYNVGLAIRDETAQIAEKLASSLHSFAQSISNNPNNVAVSNSASAILGSEQVTETKEPSEDKNPKEEENIPAQKITISENVAASDSSEIQLAAAAENPAPISNGSGSRSHSSSNNNPDATPDITPDTTPPIIIVSGATPSSFRSRFPRDSRARTR